MAISIDCEVAARIGWENGVGRNQTMKTVDRSVT